MAAAPRRRHPVLQRRERAGDGGALRGGPVERACRRRSRSASIPTSTPGRIARSRPAARKNKFGVPISRAREVYAHAAGLPGLAVIGVDTHIGSQITELAPFDNAAQLLAELARDLMADGHRLRHIDLGGGLGIPYREDDPPPPDPLAYARGHPPPHGGSRPEARLRDRPHDRRQRRHPRHARHLREARRGQDLRRRRRRHERPDPPDALRRLSRHPAGGRAAAECAAADRRRGRAGLRERRLPRPRPRPAARRRRATSSPS